MEQLAKIDQTLQSIKEIGNVVINYSGYDIPIDAIPITLGDGKTYLLTNIRAAAAKSRLILQDLNGNTIKELMNFGFENGEVTVYAKLPNGFKIPTPVGYYNPDWAIVFDNESFKYVYFIAETKGSMDSLELRDVEKAKIECAKKHFNCISNGEVKYDVVDSYESLINMLTA